MLLFSNHELRRISYIVVLVVLIAFDFAKAPIETYVNRLGDAAVASAFGEGQAPSASGQSGNAAAPKLPGSFKSLGAREDFVERRAQSNAGPIFELADAFHAAQQKARSEGRELSEYEARAVAKTVLFRSGGEHVVEKAGLMAFAQTVLPTVVLLMSAATIVAMLWMVTGRVRNIGWSQMVSLAVLMLYFLPKILGGLLPAAIHSLATPAFLCAIVLLAFVPASGDRWMGGPRRLAPVVNVRPQRRKPGAFGRLGYDE